MLGDGEGKGPGGFLLLDERFGVARRWEEDATGMQFNHDFWYQPRHNVMVSSEFAAPETFLPGLNLEEVAAGKYGQQIHFWDWQTHTLTQTIDLGEEGRLPFEIRFQHNPDSPHGYIGTVLGSSLWHVHCPEGRWVAEKVVAIPPVEVDGWPFALPAPRRCATPAAIVPPISGSDEPPSQVSSSSHVSLRPSSSRGAPGATPPRARQIAGHSL